MAGLSPMMQHYVETKQKYSDCILFYRLGDFYEMFFDDAILVSKELELTLTGKECGLEERAPMCGVPFHSATTYISRLVERGYKVAICEQMSDPATSKGLVERAVIRIVTPGTVVDPAMLDEKRSSYVLCVAFSGRQASLAYADVSTGELTVHLLLDADNTLRDELVRIQPSEVVSNDVERLNRFLTFEISRTQMPESAFQKRAADSELYGHFGVQNLSSLGMEQKDKRAIAAGALLRYLSETQMNALSHITQLTIYQGDDTMFLDRATRRNLELTQCLRSNERRGSLLWLLDKTETAMGARLLRNWVESPLINRSRIEARLSCVEALKDDFIRSEELSDALQNVADMERLLGKISYNNLNARDCLALLRSLRAVAPVKELLLSFDVLHLTALAHTMTPLDELCQLIESAIDPEPPLLISDGGVIAKGYNEELDTYRDAQQNGKQWLLNMEAAEREATGIKNLKITSNRVFG